MKSLLTAALLLLPTAVFAHGNNLAMTADSLSMTAEMFEKEFPANLKTYSGVKAWPDANMIYVKIYYEANAKFVQYHCMMNGEKLECAKL
jgi:hypothetical protein